MSATNRAHERAPAALVLATGEVFEGEAIGYAPPGGVAVGEVVFNTVLSGYQEVITDPSYAGQIITFTYPHIGNYGVVALDDEAARPFCRGVVVRDLSRRRSSWRSEEDLEAFLVRSRVPGIAGIDTRRLTRAIRAQGALPCAFGVAELDELRAAAVSATGTDGCDLVSEVTCRAPYRWPSPGEPGRQGPRRRVVAFDFGIKTSILRQLAEVAEVEVVPASTSAAEVLARRPDGVFLSNGPGDPAAVGYAVDTIRNLLGQTPIFGICLGHQLLGAALGGRTFKLPFGHHGGNQPIAELATGAVEITSHNHNYAVDAAGIAGAQVTHANLNDQVVEGISAPDRWAFSVQYHPEAGPGPHDARHLFGEFAALIDRWKATHPDSNGADAHAEA
ncbi:MAG: glutamine-hydrolyzing carbamoyl-phosphate synthase small subunit [Acidimicrobiales bacterium]